MNKDSRIAHLLAKRRNEGALRGLKTTGEDLIDFSSNDYLGLARSGQLKTNINDSYQANSFKNGSTGSRLLTGNNALTENCESYLAQFFGFENTTVFNSGYMANLAFFSSVPQRNDTVIYDEFAHACIKDGCRLSHAKRLSFKHNDLIDLEKKLKESTGAIYIACESVYSMDGDIAPIDRIIKLAKRYEAKVVVDEAHSTGVFGPNGAGFLVQKNLQKEVFAVIYTFGKGMGIHGACIAGSTMLKAYLINFSRPFIYTTAPSAFEVISILEAFKFLKSNNNLIEKLHENISYFNHVLPKFSTPSPIKSVIIGGNKKTREVASLLQQNNLDIRPILSPTVQAGSERLRICLHTFNTKEEIDLLCKYLNTGIAG
ncbi:aminotransferase class I/II-fold pyridoxal phosphate-dependent enzyme [Roseivirga sp.]|uniref:aminotransferase class I/II-fold pyridoxal phosphate-dependent enzyme n=1 Tax=Roseivirga sp. TaxID=1964215 RepID=UPI003B8AFC1F